MKLGLGTVQFGMAYGVAGHPQPSPEQVRAVLARAKQAGIDLLDTAPSYHSEEFLNCQEFNIVTKLPPGTLGSGVSEAFSHSLKALNSTQVYGLLVHQSTDILGTEGDAVVAAMQRLKAEGLVQKIGVSVYHPQDANILSERYPLDLIQLPMNVLDQRFKPLIPTLLNKHIELHVRSVFLQGLLLMALEKVPAYFNPIRGHLSRYHESVKAAGLTLVEAALGFATEFPDLRWIVGVHTLAQLETLIAASEKGVSMDYAPWALTEEAFLLPYLWRLS